MGQPYTILPAPGSDPEDEWIKLGYQAQMDSNGIIDKATREGKLAEAQRHYQQALRIAPRSAVATLNLAVVFAQAGHLNEALMAAERASLFDEKHSVIRMNRALLALEADRLDEALEQARLAAELAPTGMAGNGERVTLAMVSASAGKPENALPLYNAVLDSQPDHPAAGPNACFTQTLTDAMPEQLLKQRQRWHAAHGFKGEKKGHDNDRNPDRPLRVGYVGGDFKQHSAAFIFSRVLLHHGPAVEMYLYSSLPVDPAADARTKAFQEACGIKTVAGALVNPASGLKQALTLVDHDCRWRDISTTSDEDADKLIRRDRIDILVDLAAHTNGGRLALFTRKPAPIAVHAWGFAHGTGCPEVDTFFADPIAVREEERQHYAERIVDLPCIVTFEPPKEYKVSGISQPPLRKNGVFTFGCYARYEKMSEGYLRACADILRQVPDSRIEFKDHAYRRPYSIRRVQSFMEGVEPDRLLFSLASAHPEHMQCYQQSDLLLNPFPHSGGCVVLEQLWMGVPLLTLYGTQAAGRSGASVLAAMGRADWIARTPEEYVAKAVELATNKTKELAAARKTLRQELVESPVVKGYVEAVEAAYRQLWREWCNK